jgi:rubredoxin
MEKYKCTVCGYIYDPEEGEPSDGIEPGISFNDLPDDYICPVCGAGKNELQDNPGRPIDYRACS